MFKDLIVLVPDIDIEVTIKTLLEKRHQAFGISPIRFEIVRHPNRDAGCYTEAHDFLRNFLQTHQHALVVFDQEFGQESPELRHILEDAVEKRLWQAGWNEQRAKAVVIEPELENWVWSGAASPHLQNFLKWSNTQGLDEWLVQNGYKKRHDQPKPIQPKEAVEAIWRLTRTRHSPQFFAALAAQISFKGCQDAAFIKFRQTLQSWFGQP